MDYHQSIFCIAYSELVPAVVTVHTYRNYHNRGLFQVLRRACRGTEALIDYDSMPEKVKEKVRMVYGSDVREQAMANPLKKWMERDVQAYDFFCKYTLPNGHHLSADKQEEYTANAGALNAINNLMSDRRGYRWALGGGKNKTTWKEVQESLKALQGQWPYKLPGSERRLRGLLHDYKQNGYEALISGKLSNDNAGKMKDDEQQATLRSLLRHPNNLNDEQVLFMYNEIAKARGWRNVTRSTIANRREEWNLTTLSGRRGEQNFDNIIAMQAKRKAPGYPMLYWTVDGWDVELAYQKISVDQNGNNVTTYHNRLTVVVVLDTFNKYPIGYAIGNYENPATIKQALRNALRHTGELFGCMHRPQQLQQDRYAYKALTPFYEVVSPKNTPSKAKNAKSKVIEPYFKLLNTTYCQLSANWTGFGVTAEKDNQPNQEYKNRIRHSFPDEAGCRAQITDIIEKERAAKQEAYTSKWQQLPGEHKLPWSTEQYLYHAGEVTGYTNSLEGHGLVITIGREKLTYDCFDTDFRRYAHVKWTVKFDPETKDTVLAVNDDGTLRFLMERKYVQPMALAERADGDSEALQRIRDYNKVLKNGILEEMGEDGRRVAAMFNDYPELNDTLAKMQLVDSTGQHKDQRNDTRAIQAAEKLVARQDRQLITAEKKERENAYQNYINNKIDLSQYI